MATTHLATNLKSRFGWNIITFCTGRAMSNIFAGTSEFTEVTCKSCLKKMAKNPLPTVTA